MVSLRSANLISFDRIEEIEQGNSNLMSMLVSVINSHGKQLLSQHVGSVPDLPSIDRGRV